MTNSKTELKIIKLFSLQGRTNENSSLLLHAFSRHKYALMQFPTLTKKAGVTYTKSQRNLGSKCMK